MLLSDGNGSTRSGLGFLNLLGLLFIGLKLTGFIDWPWWVVLAPIWGQFALILFILIVAAVLALYAGDD